MSEIISKEAKALKVDPTYTCANSSATTTQNFALVSFVSNPEKIKLRTIYEMNKFLVDNVNSRLVKSTENIIFDTNVSASNLINNLFEETKLFNFDDYLNFLNSKDNLDSNDLQEYLNFFKDIQNLFTQYNKLNTHYLLEYLKTKLMLDENKLLNNVLQKYTVDNEELLGSFNKYKHENVAVLENEFNSLYGDTISITGFKVRGVFEKIEDAKNRAKILHETVEPYVDVGIVPVGTWVPYSPDPNFIKDQIYAIEELNSLMEQYNENSVKRDEFFSKRKKMSLLNEKKE